MGKVKNCDVCGASYVPREGAKRSFYCSQKCNQKHYRDAKKQAQKSKALTVSMEEATAFNRLAELVPNVETWVSRFAKIHGEEAKVSLIRVIAWVEMTLSNLEAQIKA